MVCRLCEKLILSDIDMTCSAGLGLPALAAFKSIIALVGTVSYVAFFALGAGAVPGLLVPELTPAKLRGVVLSLSRKPHSGLNRNQRYGLATRFADGLCEN